MTDSKLRVLISLHQGGGAGSVNSILRLALGVAHRGLQVRFVCPPDSMVEAEAARGGLEVHPIPLARAGRRTNAVRLSELLQRYPVDLVNAHGSKDREAFTWLGLTRRLSVPAIFTRRSWPRTSLLENWLAGRVAKFVVTLSEPVAEQLGATGIPRGKLRVIENGVLLDRLDRPVSGDAVQEWRRKIGWEGSRRTIAIVARPKDQRVVLRSLPMVATPVRLVLAGLDGEALDGPLPHVPDRHAVVRLPFVDDVRPLYELVELVLHPSRWDALPQAALEAMALGKPVIASGSTGNAVIIEDDRTGLLVDPAKPAAWARAIERVLGDAGLAARLGTAGRRRARDDFPLERTIDRTIALYRECLGRSS